jgi:hypothetical protein
MNAPDEKPLLGGEGLRRLTTRARYHARDLVQASTIWGVWRREAERLFADYWRTGDLKHLCAFVRHIHAMRAH